MARARRFLLVAAVCAAFLSALLGAGVPGGTPAPAATPGAATPSATVSATLIPAGAPPGERNPLEGALAVIAIVVVAAAGVFVYGVIRKGL